MRTTGKDDLPTTGATQSAVTGDEPVTEAEIARRAYEMFLARGATHGQDVEDWLRAERELQALEDSFILPRDQRQRSGFDRT